MSCSLLFLHGSTLFFYLSLTVNYIRGFKEKYIYIFKKGQIRGFEKKKKKTWVINIKHKKIEEQNKNSTIVLTPKQPPQTTTKYLYIAHTQSKNAYSQKETQAKLCVLSHRLSLYLPDFGAPPILSLSFIQFLAVSLAAGKAFDTCEFLKGEALKKKKKKLNIDF